jgi:aspartate racemase
MSESLAFWRRSLDGVTLPELPADRPRDPANVFSPATLPLMLPPGLAASIENLSRERNTTPPTILMAALETFLFRYTGESDICIGSIRADESVLAMLPIRCKLKGTLSFRELLTQIAVTSSEAWEHRHASTHDLVALLHAHSARCSNAVFTVTLAYQVEAAPPAGCDLSVSFEETVQGLEGSWQYNAALFDETTAARMADHFLHLLTAAVANPGEPISRLPLLSAAERERMLVEWNQTHVDYPRDRCLHELVEEQAARHPDRIAVVFQNEQLTYGELNSRANRLAHRLRALGVGPDTLVAICLERSLDTVIGLLATLKAGGAYVPLDPAYPADRLEFMLADSAAPILLTQRRLLTGLPAHQSRALCLDTDTGDWADESADNPTLNTTPENLAYVIYTSGSTGKPKGVCVPHRGAMRLLNNSGFIEFGPDDTFLHVTSLSFDPSTFEIWMPLLHGARLAIYPPGSVTLNGLGRKIRQYGVTALQLTTPLFHLMVDENLEAFRGVRSIVSGGEAFSLDHVRRALDGLPGTRLSICYGPTENSVITTAYRPASSADLQRHTSVPLGYPIANTDVYVLDEHLQPVPVGVTGELYTGGDGLARGYLNRPELTAERFIPHPFRNEPGARLYRTGDLARYLPDGNLEFRGRVDHQVKVRGYRIELGEVEAALRQHPAVREAVVIVREDTPGAKYLAAYFLAAPDLAPTANDLAGFLKKKLPAYMVPAAFVALKKLILSPNGKLDRRFLPAPAQRV